VAAREKPFVVRTLVQVTTDMGRVVVHLDERARVVVNEDLNIVFGHVGRFVGDMYDRCLRVSFGHQPTFRYLWVYLSRR
jgi:hypothetical protein